MKQVVLEKYHCMGNDYLVFDPNKNDLELNAGEYQEDVQPPFWHRRGWNSGGSISGGE